MTELSENQCRLLCRSAIDSRARSYCPYSHFAVGAALLCCDGTIYTGCNIENAAYSPSICAERTALAKAVSEGQRHFSAIAIAGGPQNTVSLSEDEGSSLLLPECPPCGVCRQVMMEFCSPDTFRIILARSADQYSICTLRDLLPLGFGPENVS